MHAARGSTTRHGKFVKCGHGMALGGDSSGSVREQPTDDGEEDAAAVAAAQGDDEEEDDKGQQRTRRITRFWLDEPGEMDPMDRRPNRRSVASLVGTTAEDGMGRARGMGPCGLG